MSTRLVALIGVENCSYSFDTLFSYLVPESLSTFLQPGMRVLVPFGNSDSLRQGFVFEIASEDEEDNSKNGLKTISSVLDSTPLLSEEMLKLAVWMRDRCFCTFFTAAKSVLPGGMCLRTEKLYSCVSDIPVESYDKLSADERSVVDFLRKKKTPVRETLILKKFGINKDSLLLKKMFRSGIISESTDAFARINDLTVKMIRLCDNYTPDESVLTDKQQSVVNILFDIGAATIKELCYFTGVGESVIRTLISKEICESFSAPVKRDYQTDFSEKVYKKPLLSTEQHKAFETLYSAYKSDGFRQALLYGVTGSGKTSVYLELIDKVLEDNNTAVVLVPEISLTPQTFSIFSGRYGKNVAVLHSGLSMAERYEEWKRINSGEVSVVIGTRSAVFAPLKNIGVIIIDEEQEHTYKSEMSPRYNAKDVARFRCAYNKSFLLFASATPSVETFARAKDGNMFLCELKSRFGNAVLPDVKTVDMTDRSVISSGFALSDVLADEVRENLKNGEQSILLVNRRGYNTFVSCTQCKNVVTCPKCSISMTYHSANNRLMCHYCGYSLPFTVNCPSCGAENIKYSGIGTQRVEQELKIRFPEARVLRMDADTTTAKNSYEKSLTAFANGEFDIMIGTQMVAKGLDFPDVTLVGITSADNELYNNDYRSAERTFDLITQVVGRAGRGNRKGRAVIQTVSPDNNILSIASRQDYVRFFNSEINMRKALIYPPFCDICEIGFLGTDYEMVHTCAEYFFEKLKKLNEGEYSSEKIIILGPLSPRVSKVNDNYRQRLIIKCRNSSSFREMIKKVLLDIMKDRSFKNVTVFADINPEKLN